MKTLATMIGTTMMMMIIVIKVDDDSERVDDVEDGDAFAECMYMYVCMYVCM